MSIFEKEQKRAIEIIDSSKDIISKIGSKMDLQTLEKAQEVIAKNETVLVVCGECSVGKSSFLTEYVKEAGLFPIDADVATNSITLMNYGETEKITVVVEKAKAGQFKEINITRDEIEDYVTEQGNKQNLKKVKMIKIETQNEVLKKGLILVDTPGVGGLDEDHSAVTSAFIPSADAVIYASEATKPLDTNELEFIRDHIAKHTQNVVFTLTKADRATKENIESIMKTNREKIAAYTGWQPENIIIVPISSLAMKNFRRRGKKEHYINSNFEELDNQIVQSYTNRKITKMIIPNINDVRNILAENYNVQATKYNTLLKDDEEIIKFKKQYEEMNKERKELLKKNTKWRALLSRETRKLVTGLKKCSRSGLDKISNKVYEDTYVNAIIKDYKHAEKYLKSIQNDINEIGVELEGACQLEVTEMLKKIEEELKEEFANTIEAVGIEQNENDLKFDKSKMASKSEKVVSIIRTASISSGLGTFAAGTTASLLGVTSTAALTAAAAPVVLAIAGVGIIVGGLSLISGTKKHSKDAKHKNNNVVLNTAKKAISDANMRYLDYIEEAKSEIEEFCIIEVENSITSKIEKYETMINELPDKINSNKDKNKAEAGKAKETVGILKGLITESNVLINAYAELSAKLARENEEKLKRYHQKVETTSDEGYNVDDLFA